MVVFCYVCNKLNIDIAARNHFNRQLQQLCDDDPQGLMYYVWTGSFNINFRAVGVHLTPVWGNELMLNNQLSNEHKTPVSLLSSLSNHNSPFQSQYKYTVFNNG